MSDDLLKALGTAGRAERDAANEAAKDAPPLDDVARERWVNAAFAELEGSAPKAAPQPKRGGRIVVFSLIAAAAIVLLFFGLRRDALPSYALSVQGGQSEWRGEEPTAASSAQRATVRADGTIEIVLRPAEPVTRPLEARAFASREGAPTKTLPVEVSGQGVGRVLGRAGELLATPERGKTETWSVVVVIGERGAVPTTAEGARAHRDVRRAELTVVVTN